MILFNLLASLNQYPESYEKVTHNYGKRLFVLSRDPVMISSIFTALFTS